MLHVQNAYPLNILRMSQLRFPTVVIALWSILLTYYLTCDYGIAVHNPEETNVLCHCARPFIFIA